jgi:hypothetical protein
VLQQVDARYFDEVSGFMEFNFDFVIFKKGSNEEYASSMGGMNWCRSRSIEVDLEAGEYVVHVSKLRIFSNNNLLILHS